jgi:hypothetical protein
MCWNSGAGLDHFDYIDVYFFKETGDCDPDTDEYAVVRATSIDDWLSGDYYYGRAEVVADIEFPGVILTPGKWWVGFFPSAIGGSDFAAALTTEVKGCQIQVASDYFGWSRWTEGYVPYGDNYDVAWSLSGEARGPPGINTYIQPGTEDIEALVKNYGTFPERDLTCYAQVKEFITDPLDGVEIKSGEIGPFNLPTPLGGTKSLDFGTCTFPDEGRYGVYLQMPNDDANPLKDDVSKKNNKMKYGIAVDDTPPKSGFALNPSTPDGKEGWYVHNLEVTLTASDPMSMDVSSGVKEIRYTINGGSEKVITGNHGTFVVTDDGEDIRIEFWAVDNVGNVESKNTVMPLVDMDQTPPVIEFGYEIVGGNQYQGWDFLWQCNATDAMSKMDRVEFYANDVLQETVSGPGPVYQWQFRYWANLHITFKAVAFDKAGNSIFLEIPDPDCTPHSAPNQHSSNNTPRARPNPR